MTAMKKTNLISAAQMNKFIDMNAEQQQKFLGGVSDETKRKNFVDYLRDTDPQAWGEFVRVKTGQPKVAKIKDDVDYTRESLKWFKNLDETTKDLPWD
jgi:hypothetical protein